MIRTILCLLSIIFTITVPLSSCATEKHLKVPYGISPDSLPEVLTESTFPAYKLGSLEKIYGFQGKDVSNKDFSQLSLQFISRIAFDVDTKWPGAGMLPKGFSPDKWINIGKDPGLQLSDLHKKGYTGKGISVAVIDKPIISTHNEFMGRMEYIPIGVNQPMHFHGLSCASILAGRTCGVAPEAKLYYFAVPDNGQNFHNYSLAIDKLLEINKSLTDKNKIQVVSVSDGIPEDSEYRQEWSQALQKAGDEGIMVLYSNNVSENFLWGGCPPFKDKDDPSNYAIAEVFKGDESVKSSIILPADYRATAANQGNRQCAYWGDGGFSWAIPYLAGLCALGLQIDPDLKYEDMVSAIKETKTTTSEGYQVINPAGFIKTLENRKN